MPPFSPESAQDREIRDALIGTGVVAAFAASYVRLCRWWCGSWLPHWVVLWLKLTARPAYRRPGRVGLSPHYALCESVCTPCSRSKDDRCPARGPVACRRSRASLVPVPGGSRCHHVCGPGIPVLPL